MARILKSRQGQTQKRERKRRRAQQLGPVAAQLIRSVGMTLRTSLHDKSGFVASPPDRRIVHALWHDSLFAWPTYYFRHCAGRRGVGLTSASEDGELVAAVIQRFGIHPVRGSSSRRGAAAVLELKQWMDKGYDVAITPDGPRGPRRKLKRGMLHLAQMTDSLIIPYRLVYHNAWRLNSWDRFQIPKPFSRVEIHLGAYVPVPANLSEAEWEEIRIKVEREMGE